ncbi:MAG TPA: hypothetical protein VF152_06700 [Acidimicrobiia bacterium]
MGRHLTRVAAAVALLAATAAFGEAGDEPTDVVDTAVEITPGCDFLDARKCLYPFPNDWFTVADDSTDTGRRVDFAASAMPVNVDGVVMDPAEWNRNDGFSPGSPVITYVPGVDLDESGAAPSTDIGGSRRDDAPIVLLDAETGRKVPYWAELDQSIDDPADRPVIVRPAVNLLEGHRYVVALRDLRDARGQAIPAPDAFRVYRDDIGTDDETLESRREHMEELFATLDDAGVERDELYLAWDFTVASQRNLSERLLHIRDDAFAALGDAAPTFAVTGVEEPDDEGLARIVDGTFQVPLYLTGAGEPGSRFNSGSGGLPAVNGEYTADFRCVVPDAAFAADGAARPARPSIYGHGLLGSQEEVDAGNVVAMADEHGFVFCATKWIGMSEEDVGNAAAILAELGRFPSLADRLQQGVLNTLFLGRLMIHEDGLAADPAFEGADGESVIDRAELFYDGNSQGGIMGGIATAVATDWERAVLGVPAMNYSTLLHRSVDFDVYEDLLDPAYPDEHDRSLGIALIQMLWDRGEANGYAQHLTDDPYPGTPEHTVLLHKAYGDHQVANVATEVQARTIGACSARPAIRKSRSPDAKPLWGVCTIDEFPYGGSAIVVWDSGAPPPPPGNVAPREGEDPHGDPRSARAARRQKAEFLAPDGELVDVCDAEPCTAPPSD